MYEFRMESEAELEPVVTSVLAKLKDQKDTDTASVVALHGDLGAGKTTFTKELARQLGVSEVVVSPTFVVMKSYETENTQWAQLIHIDAYRIEDVDEMRVLHFTEMLAQKNTIITIEWAEKIAALLPEATTHLTFTAEGETRIITNHG